eukprot:COSAG06_NODE_1537_length_9151_cov_2.179187_7_plen_121_part_00
MLLLWCTQRCRQLVRQRPFIHWSTEVPTITLHDAFVHLHFSDKNMATRKAKEVNGLQATVEQIVVYCCCCCWSSSDDRAPLVLALLLLRLLLLLLLLLLLPQILKIGDLRDEPARVAGQN